MFSKKTLHLSFALVLLIALASFGIAYGAWTDTLNINGTVGTGSLDIDFDPAMAKVHTETDPLNVATCTVTATEDLATLTIENAYPGVTCKAELVIKNTGTIPVNIDTSWPAQSLDHGGVTTAAYPIQKLDFKPFSSGGGWYKVWPMISISNAAKEGATYSVSWEIPATQ